MADQIPVQKTYSVQYLVGALVLGLIIGVLISSLWGKTEKSKIESVTTAVVEENVSDDEINTPSLPSGEVVLPTVRENELVIANQRAGLSVMVTKADVADTNWVVIHEDRNGVPGNALGAARFVDGTTSGTIELLRGTTAGQTYHGIIYKDDGDKIFSMERDVPLRDESGNPVGVTFKTN